ncbi:MAG: O-antigen ligase family protein [Endomicrobium sp.]|jgi:putative inorganic carbon (HCO3(-)) transporter|nr:O-antigen ligase family protein [Endomicrobium sp.]
MYAYSSFVQKSLTKIILYGIPVLYFLIAVGFYLKTYDSAQIKITLLHLGGLFLIAVWIIARIEKGKFGFFKKNFVFILPVLAFLVSGIISFAHSPFPYTSLNEVVKRFIYCFFALILITEFNDEKKISRILNWLIAAAYIACIYGVIQLLDYYLFPPPPDSGLDPFLWRQAFGHKIFSTFGNPNFFGDFLVVMNPIVLGLYLYKRNFYLMFLWILILICAIFTVSKGTWLGFSAGSFVFVLVYLFTIFRERLTKKMLIFGGITIMAIFLIAFFAIFAQTKKRTDSASFRLFTWLSAWEMINTNPIFGTGIGSFYVTYPAWRRPQIFFIEAKHNTESDHPENEYLEVWFDEGIVGFVLFLFLICFVFMAGYKNIEFFHSGKGSRDSPMPYIQLGVLAAFAAQLVHDMVCVSLRFVSSGIMLWLLIGITLSICVNSSNDKIIAEDSKNIIPLPIKLIVQVIVIILAVISIKYFAGYFKADYLHSRAIQLSKISNWDMALKTYDDVNKANPSFPMSRYFQGNVHLDRWKAGDPILAEKSFKELWKLAPNYVQSKYLAGLMYHKNFNDALSLKNKYVQQNNHEKAKEMEIPIKENYDLAVKYYNEYMMIDPIFPLTYYQLASIYSAVGNLQMVEKTLKDHLEYPANLSRHPHDFWVENWEKRRSLEYSETYVHLGHLYLANSKFQEAHDAYIKALELNPDNINALKNLTNVYAGNNEKITQVWLEVFRKFPNDEDAIKYLEPLGLIKRIK